MIIIQEASAKIAQVSDKLSGLENNNQEVVAALKDLSNKVASLENERVPNHPGKSVITKAPLYIRVSNRVSEGVFGQWGLSGHAANITRSVGLSVRMYHKLILLTCCGYEHRRKSLGNEADLSHTRTTPTIRTSHRHTYQGHQVDH